MRHHHFARQYLSLQLWFSNKVWLNFWLLQLKIVFQLKGCLLFGEIMVDLSRTFSEQGRKIWSDFRAYQIWFLQENHVISRPKKLVLAVMDCPLPDWQLIPNGEVWLPAVNVAQKYFCPSAQVYFFGGSTNISINVLHNYSIPQGTFPVQSSAGESRVALECSATLQKYQMLNQQYEDALVCQCCPSSITSSLVKR